MCIQKQSGNVNSCKIHCSKILKYPAFGTVKKWSLRPLLDSPKGGLNIGILLYIYAKESSGMRIHARFTVLKF